MIYAFSLWPCLYMYRSSRAKGRQGGHRTTWGSGKSWISWPKRWACDVLLLLQMISIVFFHYSFCNQKRRFGISSHTHSFFSCMFNSENWFQKRLRHKEQVCHFCTQEDVGLSWHYWWTCGCTLASVLVSAFAITCAALSIENECRINPLNKTKDPWHWTCFQGACMQAWWDGSSIFVWQVKPPKPRYEPNLWHRRAPAMSFSRSQKKNNSKIIQDATSPCVAWFACSLSSPVQ